MPTTKTAEKELRASERRKARNKSLRGQTKTLVTKAEEAISAGNIDLAASSVKFAIRALDKEAEKGTEHVNNASRRKSRLVKKLNKLSNSSKPGPDKK